MCWNQWDYQLYKDGESLDNLGSYAEYNFLELYGVNVSGKRRHWYRLTGAFALTSDCLWQRTGPVPTPPADYINSKPNLKGLIYGGDPKQTTLDGALKSVITTPTYAMPTSYQVRGGGCPSVLYLST